MPEMNSDAVSQKIDSILPVVKQIDEQFKNPVRTLVVFVIYNGSLLH